MTKIKLEFKFIISALNIFLILLFLLLESNFVISALFLLWMNMTIYAGCEMKTRGMLFAFCIAFFSFLMGRHLLSYYFNYEVEYFSDTVNSHAELCLLLSLVSICLSYVFFYQKNKKYNKQENQDVMLSNRYIELIQRYSLRLFWISLLFSIIYAVFTAVLVAKMGYLASYTVEGMALMRGNVVLVMLNRIEQALPVALCCYLATFPNKKSCNKICGFYFLYLILTLLGGQRGPFILGCLFLMIYYFYRNKMTGEVWIKKRWIKWGVVLFPFILVGLGLFSQIRVGDKVEFKNIGDSVVKFVYNNGVSINVIKRAYELDDRLRADRYYSMHFLHDGIFGFVFGSEGTGNNADRAIEGYRLAHALPYLMFREQYLEGKGTGTTYIAELWHDFGYLGVILGNLFYGFLLASLANYDKNKPFLTSIKLLIIIKLLWAPRGGFTEFISILSLPATIFVYVVLFLGVFLVYGAPKRRYVKSYR